MADEERDEQTAAWLAIEPLDEVTRRRLVSRALSASADPSGIATDAPSAGASGDAAAPPVPRAGARAWRWIAAAAAVVVVSVAGLALLTAEGGHDEQRTALATQDQRAEGGAAPSALAAVPTVGDYGDLDRAANVDALRRALTGAAGPSASSAAGPASSREADRTSSTAAASPVAGCPSALDALGAATVLAQGSGTLDGRPVVVVLSSRADGTRSIDAITGPPACSVRHLANP